MEYFLEATWQKFTARSLKIFKTRVEKIDGRMSEEYTDGASRYTRVDPLEICLLRRGTPVPGAKYSCKEGETAKMLFLWARAARTLLCPIGCLDGVAVSWVVQSSSFDVVAIIVIALRHAYNCKSQIDTKPNLNM